MAQNFEAEWTSYPEVPGIYDVTFVDEEYEIEVGITQDGVLVVPLTVFVDIGMEDIDEKYEIDYSNSDFPLVHVEWPTECEDVELQWRLKKD